MTPLVPLTQPGALGQPPTPNAPGIALVALQPGAVLQASVLATTGPGRVLLQVGPARFEVRTQAPLAVGEALTLEVTQAGRLVVLARRETAEAARPLPGRRQLDAVTGQLIPLVRDRLPRQHQMSDLLQSLRRLASAGTDASAGAARSLLQRLPDRASLTSTAGLAAWLARYRTLTDAADSLDEQLLGLLAQLRGAGPGARAATDRSPAAALDELRQHLAGVLARRELLALRGAASAGREQVVLTTELPVTGSGDQSEVIGIHITRERPDGAFVGDQQHGQEDVDEGLQGEVQGSSGHSWRVTLSFSPPNIGTLQATILLSEETGMVSTRFETADEHLCAHVTSGLAALHQRLSACGLHVDELLAAVTSSADGEGGDPLRSALGDHTRALLDGSLIDEQA